MNEEIEIKKVLEPLLNFLSTHGYEGHLITQDKKRTISCPPCGYPPPVPKKNAWIVWILDDKKRICDLEVYDRDPENQDRWDRVLNYVDMHLKSYLDIGNNCSYWESETLESLILKFYIQYLF